MIKFFIDNRALELAEGTEVLISFSTTRMSQMDARKEEVVREIRVPITPANRTALGYTEQILSPDLFNQTAHPARIEADGVPVVAGEARIASCENRGVDGGWYHFEVVEEPRDWVLDASEKLMRELPITYQRTISASLVRESWTDSSPVKFFPVERNRYDEADFENEIPPTRTLTYEDYHPFVNIRAAVDAIVGATGYTISSAFMDGAYFRSLYVSGYYPSKEIDLIKLKMNFFAGRFQDTTTTANLFGVVFTSPYELFHSVGNLVDTADPTLSHNGHRLDGCFNNGGCFKKVDQRVAFVPSEAVTAGFEYRLRYRSDFVPDSSSTMKGFTEIDLGDGVTHHVYTANPLTDYQGYVTYAGSYTVVNFHYDVSVEARLRIVAGGVSDTIAVTAREQVVNLASGTTSAVLQIKALSTWIDAQGWAIYKTQDYTEATRNVEMDVTLRTTPKLLSRNQPIYFDLVRFSGAYSGTAFTLLKDTTVRPVFYQNPMEGSTVTTAELFAHEACQIELIEGLQQLFRLCFYTDNLTKTIYVEPYDSFFRSDRVVDWRGKTDESHAVSVEELGADRARSVALLYRDGDGAVMRWNENNKKKYARWRTSILNLSARATEENDVNPFFSPSINITRTFPQARSASILQAGDRAQRGANYDDGDLNFPPKIVRYLGLKSLPAGEAWGWPVNAGYYPLIAFHRTAAGENFTLCFDDFESQAGLHSYHDRYFATINHGKQITAKFFLGPDDVDPILHPGTAGDDFRALFRLRIYGEEMLCRLKEIVDWNPASNEATTCIFIKEE